jgi:hypothetical protein
MSATIVGAALKFGTQDETWGYCESLSVKYSSEKEEIKNGQGDIKSIIYHGQKASISGSYSYPTADSTAFAVGQSMTFTLEAGKTLVAYVDSWGTEYKQGAHATRSFEATYYPDLGSGTGS